MFPNLLTNIIDYSSDLFRNIKTARISIDCYDDLGGDLFDTQVATHAEMEGHEDSHAPVITRPFDYGTAIAYSFDASNWQATRFSNGVQFGVWYGSEQMDTTIFETIYHWKRFVRDSFGDIDKEIIADRRVVLVCCKGLLVDLVGKEANFPALIDPDDYGFTQQVGSYLKRNNQSGLRTLSARCDGINVAIMNQETLSNPRDYCYLTYHWNPSTNEKCRVVRESGATLLMV